MTTTITTKTQNLSKRAAVKFVILIGIVSLFADMTYEGARSITGPFLAILGANAVVVGFVSGFGELLGYGLRSFSGYFSDRTGRYWTIAIIGYVCNLLAVPLLAFANHWWMAAGLMMLERMGKGLRVPPRDAMLSHTGHAMGMGWAFGLHEALDKTGAMLGPLLIAGVLFYKGSYQQGFAILFIPALLAILTLSLSRWMYPNPQSLEMEHESLAAKGMNISYWLYLAAAAFIAAGYADFSLLAYHFQKTNILSPVWIPVSYSLSMGVSAIAAPLMGHWYDRKGFVILVMVSILSCWYAPLVLMGDAATALIGVCLWSVGVGAHEALMRAIVGKMVSPKQRGSAYGIFNTGFGVFWFLGSVAMGYLYDVSIPMVVVFSIGIQLLAMPLLWIVMRQLQE